MKLFLTLLVSLFLSSDAARACSNARLRTLEHQFEQMNVQYDEIRARVRDELRAARATVSAYHINIFSHRGHLIQQKQFQIDVAMEELAWHRKEMWESSAKIHFECFDKRWPAREANRFNTARTAFGTARAQVQNLLRLLSEI
jgi:hypothetical protein